MKKIDSIGNVFFGVNHSPDKSGNIPLIQAGSINGRGDYSPEQNAFIHSEKLSGKEYLQAGDLLFAAKGVNNFPYVVKEEDLPATASSIFFVIRVDIKQILPEFLAWYLKTKKAKHWIGINSEGSTINSISIKEFRQFKVPVPEIDIQEKVIRLHLLQGRYKSKVTHLLENIDLVNEEISKQLIKQYG
ncbi:MAG: restriction endonuclease subunit S [Balneolaceae bacterium]